MASAGSRATISWSHRSCEGINDMPSTAEGQPAAPTPRPVPEGADPAQPRTATAEAEGDCHCRRPEFAIPNAGADTAATTGLEFRVSSLVFMM
jgi:hypothetical protein